METRWYSTSQARNQEFVMEGRGLMWKSGHPKGSGGRAPSARQFLRFFYKN